VGLETGVWFVHTTDGTIVECNSCGWVREIVVTLPLEQFPDDRLARCEQCGATMTHLLGEISELPFQ
jgi:predicted nucleic acid-binding Zn ribbon protein